MSRLLLKLMDAQQKYEENNRLRPRSCFMNEATRERISLHREALVPFTAETISTHRLGTVVIEIDPALADEKFEFR